MNTDIHLMVITDGRGDCLERTVRAADKMLKGPIGSMHIIDDSMDRFFGEWLRRHFMGFDVHSFGRKLGFGGAIQAGWSLVPTDATHVFHLEDDFVIRTEIDLGRLVALLEEEPQLAQVVLKRQAWNDQEKAAGGIVECWPDQFTEHSSSVGPWTAHRLFFSTNPSLYRFELLERGWPDGDGSERTFTDELLADPELVFGFWGAKFAPPIVEHIGLHRAGTGY